MEEWYPDESGLITECMYYAYVLQSARSGAFYIGQTNDLARRLRQHNDPERVSWTSKRGPWELVYSMAFNTRPEAMKYERYLKSLKSKRGILRFINKGV